MGKFRTLDRAKLTKAWNVDERAGLAYFLEERKFPEGDPIFLKLSKDRCLFIVESGCVRLSVDNLSVDFRDGESFGELSLIGESQKLSSAVTTQATILWVLTYDRWLELKRNAPSVAVKLMESIMQKIISHLAQMQVPPKLGTTKLSSGGLQLSSKANLQS